MRGRGGLEATPETGGVFRLAAATVAFSLPIQRSCVFLVEKETRQTDNKNKTNTHLQKYMREAVQNCVPERKCS